MIRLESKKDASLVTWTIKRPIPPEKVRTYLNQAADLSAIPCVTLGDSVLVGQKIAEPATAQGVAVHASVSGKVTSLDKFPHPFGYLAEAVEIRTESSQHVFPGVGQERQGWEHLPRAQILSILQQSGVVDLQSLKPVHAQCASLKPNTVHTLIINACESEPYLTCDHVLMMAKAIEILKGAEILRKLTDAEKVVIAIEDNKLEAAEILKSKIYFLKWDHFSVEIFPARYPQGAEALLMRDLLGADFYDLKEGSFDSARMFNVGTAFAVYEAVALQKPFYERVVTVGGGCVVESRNVWAPLGTSFEDVFKFCRGLLRKPRKVLMNGPMTGFALPDMNVSVIAGTQAVLALPDEQVFAEEEVAPCIRCNRCVEACPVGISPVMITLAAENQDFETADDWGAELCIECGNCSYVCPSKRPMVELIRYADSVLQGTSPKRLPSMAPSRRVYPKEKEIFVETL